MPAYRDNPFELSNHSEIDLQNYYDDAPPPNRLSTTSPPDAGRTGDAFNNIPLTAVPGSNSPYQAVATHNQPWSADSMDDLHTPIAREQNPFSGGTPMASRVAVGGGIAPAGLDGRAPFAESEPKLGAYAPGSTWMGPNRPKSNKRKWVIMGIALAVLGIIIIAVTVGVVVANNSKKGTKNLSSSSSSSGASSSSPVQQTDPNDPSKFTKDSNLHQSFYGIAYTPVGSQLPDCGNSLAAVIQDVQIMSQLTTRIRLYGADCNQSALVLEAVKQTKVNMTVFLGNYPIPTDNGTAYERQRDVIKSAIQTYGTDHVGGITVGNEFMLNYVNANGVTDPNSAVANTGAQILIGNIQDTRSMLTGLGVSLPVGNADAGSYFNNEVLAAVDYGMANVHPWFANVTAEASAAWTAEFFSEQDVALANNLTNKPKMYIAETGWPTKSSDAGNANNGASTASIANFQTFLDTFICQANNNGTGYFFFEFADEDWKDKQFGGVEGWWGLFNQDRTLKSGITVPNCQSP